MSTLWQFQCNGAWKDFDPVENQELNRMKNNAKLFMLAQRGVLVDLGRMYMQNVHTQNIQHIRQVRGSRGGGRGRGRGRGRGGGLTAIRSAATASATRSGHTTFTAPPVAPSLPRPSSSFGPAAVTTGTQQGTGAGGAGGTFVWEFEDFPGNWKPYLPADQALLENGWKNFGHGHDISIRNRFGRYRIRTHTDHNGIVRGSQISVETRKSRNVRRISASRRGGERGGRGGSRSRFTGPPFGGPVATSGGGGRGGASPRPPPSTLSTSLSSRSTASAVKPSSTKNTYVWEFLDKGSWSPLLPGDVSELERAFVNGTRRLTIRNRFGTYDMFISRSGQCYQVNTKTGTKRPIRRAPRAQRKSGTSATSVTTTSTTSTEGGSGRTRQGVVMHPRTLRELDRILHDPANKTRPIVVDFFASWCGPCKRLAPKIEEMARTYPRALFVKIDASKERAAASKYRVAAFPFVKFFRNGSDLKKDVRGLNPRAILRNLIPLLGNSSVNFTAGTTGGSRASKIGTPPPASSTTTTTSTHVVWEWFDDSTWRPYPPSVVAKLEAATRVGSQARFVDVDAGFGKVYQIDLGTKQQKNIRTGFFRRVRRRDLSNGTAATPTVVTTTTTTTTAAKTTGTSTKSADDHDDDVVKPFADIRVDETDCWARIAPLRAKQNPRLLVSSPLEAIAKECKATGRKFVDRQFPPSKLSVNWNPARPSAVRYAGWERIAKISPSGRPQVFGSAGGADPDDVVQGRIGNCWFLQCLCALATRPRILRRLISPKTFSPCGAYTVKVWDEGKWHYVVVDSYLPVQGSNNYLSCARCRDRNEFWVQLIEKAFAKLHTCYQSMVGGSNTYCFGPTNVLRMLTASPALQLSTKRIDVEETWKALESRTNKGWIIGCGTYGAGGQLSGSRSHQAKSMGLVPGHAYTVLGTIVLPPQSAKPFGAGPTSSFGGPSGARVVVASSSVSTKPVRLVRVRNTWGRKEWQGAWSDNDSANWTPATKRLVVNKFGSFNEKDDGIFFIPVEDFHRYYDDIYCADIVDDEYGNTSVLHTSWSKDATSDPVFDMHFTFVSSAAPVMHVEVIVNRKDHNCAQRPSIQFTVDRASGGGRIFQSPRSAQRNLFGSCTVPAGSAKQVLVRPTCNPSRQHWTPGQTIRFSLVVRSNAPFRICRNQGSCHVSAPQALSLRAMPSSRGGGGGGKPTTIASTAGVGVVRGSTKSARWEWMSGDDGYTFTPYDAKTSAAIERAFQQDEGALVVSPIPGKSYRIDLRAMHQTSQRGFHREIRRRRAP